MKIQIFLINATSVLSDYLLLKAMSTLSVGFFHYGENGFFVYYKFTKQNALKGQHHELIAGGLIALYSVVEIPSWLSSTRETIF